MPQTGGDLAKGSTARYIESDVASEKLPDHVKKPLHLNPHIVRNASLPRQAVPPTRAEGSTAISTASTITLPAASVASRFNVIPGRPLPQTPFRLTLFPLNLLPLACSGYPFACLSPAKAGPLPSVEPANRTQIQSATAANAGSSSQLYFEVGKFKDPLLAYRATDSLTRLGFHATVVTKGHFWANAYHVLVGPNDDDKAEDIRKKLMSSGFKPQVFERGSRNLAVYGGLRDHEPFVAF